MRYNIFEKMLKLFLLFFDLNFNFHLSKNNLNTIRTNKQKRLLVLTLSPSKRPHLEKNK